MLARPMNNDVLVADSFRLLRQGICALVNDSGHFSVIADAAEGKEAVRKAELYRPAIAMIDLALPGLSGLDTILQIRRRCPNTRVLAMSQHCVKEYYVETLKAGAEGFLLKNTCAEEILVALHSLAGGRRYVSADVAASLVSLNELPASSTQTLPPSKLQQLTLRERSVFKLIAEGHTNKSAASYLNLSLKTIEKHRSNLMQKLHLRSAVELAYSAVELGVVSR
jgi:DNA-binding NarL/FixJ family response regulator